MIIQNEHILKGDWLMYQSPYLISDVRMGSPLIDKETYDAFNFTFNGVAIALSSGKKYIATKAVFDRDKKVFENKYYIETWRIV